jgi:hypothetical protein
LNPTVRTALSKLKSHHTDAAVKDLRAAFAADPGRAMRLPPALMICGWIIPNARSMTRRCGFLPDLPRCRRSRPSATGCLPGEAINSTEGRAVLHTALRAATDADIRVDGENVVPGCTRCLTQWQRSPTGCAADTVRRHRQAVHRCGQYRHWRLRSRSGDGDAGAGALS